MNFKGTYAYLNKSIFRRGWEIYLRKYENGKIYRPLPDTLQWVETNEYEASQPIPVDKLENHEGLDSESKLAGENLALKEEIRFLRDELSKALARKS